VAQNRAAAVGQPFGGRAKDYALVARLSRINRRSDRLGTKVRQCRHDVARVCLWNANWRHVDALADAARRWICHARAAEHVALRAHDVVSARGDWRGRCARLAHPSGNRGKAAHGL
jgi:hypothetical protein